VLKRIAVMSCIVLASVGRAQQLTPQARLAAATMMAQFETVGYVTTDFLDVDLNTGVSPRYLATALPLRWPFLVLLGGLKGLGPDTVAAVERNYSAFVAGANNFTGPKGIGMAAANQCYVGISDNGGRPDLDVYFQKAASEQVNGDQIRTWFVDEGEAYPNKRSKFYASQVGAYLLVCHTLPLEKAHESDVQNNTFFANMANSLKNGSARLTLPDSITAHPLWIYRTVVQRDLVGGTLPANLKTLALYTDFADPDHAAVTFEAIGSDHANETAPVPRNDFLHMQISEAGIWTKQVLLAKGRFTPSTDMVAEMVSDFGFGMVL
jgi:hypothetical protein